MGAHSPQAAARLVLDAVDGDHISEREAVRKIESIKSRLDITPEEAARIAQYEIRPNQDIAESTLSVSDIVPGSVFGITVCLDSVWELDADHSYSGMGVVSDSSGCKHILFDETTTPLSYTTDMYYHMSHIRATEEVHTPHTQAFVETENQNRTVLKTTESSSLTELTVSPDDSGLNHVRGQITLIDELSGVIRRCDEQDCGRVIRPKDHSCPEHGETREYTHDLAVKATIDTGGSSKGIIFKTDHATELVGNSVEEAVTQDRVQILQRLETLYEGRSVYALLNDQVRVPHAATATRPERPAVVVAYHFDPKPNPERITALQDQLNVTQDRA